MPGFGPRLRPPCARSSLRASYATAQTHPSLSWSPASSPLGRKPPGSRQELRHPPACRDFGRNPGGAGVRIGRWFRRCGSLPLPALGASPPDPPSLGGTSRHFSHLSTRTRGLRSQVHPHLRVFSSRKPPVALVLPLRRLGSQATLRLAVGPPRGTARPAFRPNPVFPGFGRRLVRGRSFSSPH